ncbi:ATP-binding protein [Cohnella lubricantis]|uniref:histidine kinase n=1 Tax=Cohnella lubricantis TaxID=2163172 RepID=A0A841TEW5_9BACL|nr:ATP-binding protein [Cohnella lubricantis]MBB6679814.1 PAS domain S-box protein [Cohnella lubricantis]MBP2117730.1 PAS domain S-box-containing protein [Cohnella lubricantis]
MTIKAKLSVFIFALVAVILILNISIYYVSTKSDLETRTVHQLRGIAEQVGATVQATEQASNYMESTVGLMLRNAAIAAKDRLDSRIDHVTNEQLVEVAREVGVDQISLWVRKSNGDIVIAKSSDPKELGQSAKTWDYWFTAFTQLFEKQNVTISEGQALEHYWSGPFNFATSDPSDVNKWGYYYDGTTDYIIDPFIDASVFMDFQKTAGTEAVIDKIVKDNPAVLDISGFDPQFFGRERFIQYKQGKPVFNLDVRDVVFGSYRFSDPSDAENILRASETGKIVTVQRKIGDAHILKSFIPVSEPSPYVIGFSFDGDSLRRQVNHQLTVHIMISSILAAVALFASYWLAGLMLRPVNRILSKVNEVAEGRFDSKIKVYSKDELGLLSTRINAMGDSLQHYMSRLRESAEELRHTKQYLESFVNHTSDAIHVSELDGRVMQVNHAFEAMYGWNEEEIIGVELNNVPDEHAAEYSGILETVLQGGSVADLETVRYAKNGKPFDVSLTVSSIRDERGAIVAVATISRNITVRKQTEELLRRSEKLSAVGQLAAGVAHEIRNPLTTLRGFVQLQQKQEQLAPAYLQIMLTELDRINYIVSELLVFAKPQAERFRMAPVADIIRDIALLLDSEARMNNVSIDIRCEGSLPDIRCESNQLKQVFLNLLKNGMEAMPSGGRMRVDAGVSPDGNELVLRFIDEGEGIPEEHLSRLGEPFYSTKENGNGLGLMVSQQIIANHKGEMRFESELGRGTCVEIRLPIPASGSAEPKSESCSA